MKENQRVRISKKCLKESLIRLLKSKSIHKISVREICDGAEINRTTFYKYYGSQYDLLRDMEDEALLNVDNSLVSIENVDEDALHRLLRILNYLQENLDLFRILVNNTLDTDFPRQLLTLPMIKQLLKDQLEDEYSRDDLDYIYEFIVNGGYQMIKIWVNRDERCDPEHMAWLLSDVVSKIFGQDDASASTDPRLL